MISPRLKLTSFVALIIGGVLGFEFASSYLTAFTVVNLLLGGAVALIPWTLGVLLILIVLAALFVFVSRSQPTVLSLVMAVALAITIGLITGASISAGLSGVDFWQKNT